MKAFIIGYKGMAMFGVVAAETASKARYKAFLSGNDAGYGITFSDISVHRNKDADVWARHEPRPNSCYTMEYLESAIVAARQKESEQTK